MNCHGMTWDCQGYNINILMIQVTVPSYGLVTTLIGTIQISCPKEMRKVLSLSSPHNEYMIANVSCSLDSPILPVP